MLAWSVMDRRDLQNLRQALASRKSGRGRLPRALREAALAHARRRYEAGATSAAIAAELGVSYETVRRWTSSPRLVPVEVIDGRIDATGLGARTFSMISAAGFHVDGLTLDEAAAL